MKLNAFNHCHPMIFLFIYLFIYLYFSAPKSSKRIESAGLSDFAKHALKEMCCQKWVREKILKDPQALFREDMLMDSELSNKQVSGSSLSFYFMTYSFQEFLYQMFILGSWDMKGTYAYLSQPKMKNRNGQKTRENQ